MELLEREGRRRATPPEATPSRGQAPGRSEAVATPSAKPRPGSALGHAPLRPRPPPQAPGVAEKSPRKVKVLVSQSCPILSDSMDCSPPGSSVHGILQARILEWEVIPFSRGSSRPGIGTTCIGRWVLHQHRHLGSPRPTSEEVKVAQSCPTLRDPRDYTVHGILRARTLEWVAYLFSRGSSRPRDRTQISCIAGGFFTS